MVTLYPVLNIERSKIQCFFLSNSNNIYYIFYNNKDGKRARISTKTKNKSSALKFLSNFNNELKERNEQETIKITVQEFFWEYLKYSENIHSINTTLSIKSTVNKLNEYFKNKYLNDISLNEITDYIHYRKKNTSRFCSK